MQKFKAILRLVSLILTICLLGSPASAQQKRTGSPRNAAPASEPAPTFDSLLSDDSYRVYSEARNVGQLARSPALNDLINPMSKLAGPSKEFNSILKWIKAHGESLAGSRMFIASWPNRPALPSVLAAIEFATADEARKFESQLRSFVPTLSPKPSPSPTRPSGSEVSNTPTTSSPNVVAVLPSYEIRQLGSLVLLSDSTVSLPQLKPRGSRLLAENPNFAAARNRFVSESLFLYVDVKSIEKEQREQRQKWEKEEQRRAEIEAAQPPKEEIAAADETESPMPAAVDEFTVSHELPGPAASPQAAVDQNSPDHSSSNATLSGGAMPLGAGFFSLYSAFFGGQPKWPEAVGAGLAFEDEGYALRVLIVGSEENKSSPIFFVPQFISGPALAPAAAGILPADTHLFVAVSLDYPQIYEGMAKALIGAEEAARKYRPTAVSHTTPTSPFAAYEKVLGVSIKEDLLPLLGNEIAVALPRQVPQPTPVELHEDSAVKSETEEQKAVSSSTLAPVIAISIRDKEGVRKLIPKVIESMGLKQANLFAQTEKRDDTEFTSYANLFAYAFIGDFLVLATDAAATRYVVDSYLKRQTLASDPHFRNATRWQGRQLLGQAYVAPSLIDLYYPLGKGSGEGPNAKMKELIEGLDPQIEPLSYSLSNEGQGLLHELHVPRSLLMFMLAGMSSQADKYSITTNESIAKSVLRTLVSAEATFQATKGDGRYGTIEELVSENLLSKDLVERPAYKIELSVSSNKFEATAVPGEYGKTGRLSFFVDESGVLRGGDHGGGAATIADKPIAE